MQERMAKDLAPLLLSVAAVAIAVLLTVSSPSETAATARDTTPPVAVAGPDATVAVGDQLAFYGDLSSDDVRVASWRGSFAYADETVTLEDEKVFFTFDRPGTYLVELVVSDPSGNLGVDALTVTAV